MNPGPDRVGTPPSPPSLPSPPGVSVLSPELRPCPLPHGEEAELECSVCYSQFNNVFRCPKVLTCRHTFCLECLARINVKSLQPAAICCPLCRHPTPLPALGLPRLTTDVGVLASLPAAMQRVYSIRFQRSKGRLQVKRLSDGQPRWGERTPAADRSLDVGLPSPLVRDGEEEAAGGVGGAFFRLMGRPVCRALLLTLVLMMTVVLTAVVVFYLTHDTHAL